MRTGMSSLAQAKTTATTRAHPTATLGIEDSKQSQNVFVMNLGERVRTALAQVDSDLPMVPAVTTKAIDDAPVIDVGTNDSTDHPDEADEASDDVIEVIECELE